MGPSKSKPEDNTLISYDRFGEVRVNTTINQQTGDEVGIMEMSRQVSSEKQYTDWVKQIGRIEDSQTRETIFLPQKHTFVKSGLCGSAGNVTLTYENFPFVLSREISNRSQLNRYFNEPEMWYLLYSMIRAANKFEKVKKKIGDINLQNVLINDDGQIKVLSTCSIPGQIDNFHKKVQDKNAKVYLAPEELREQNLQKGEYPTGIDPCKAQVFSIGLTILSSGILYDCFQIYEMNRVNENRLNQYLAVFREKYQIKMLEIRPNQRRSASDIYHELSPYEQNILQLEPFGQRPQQYPQQHPQSHFYNNSSTHPTSNVGHSHFAPPAHNSAYMPQNNISQRVPANSSYYPINQPRY